MFALYSRAVFAGFLCDCFLQPLRIPGAPYTGFYRACSIAVSSRRILMADFGSLSLSTHCTHWGNSLSALRLLLSSQGVQRRCTLHSDDPDVIWSSRMSNTPCHPLRAALCRIRAYLIARWMPLARTEDYARRPRLLPHPMLSTKPACFLEAITPTARLCVARATASCPSQ
jgi:hypothetical protein